MLTLLSREVEDLQQQQFQPVIEIAPEIINTSCFLRPRDMGVSLYDGVSISVVKMIIKLIAELNRDCREQRERERVQLPQDQEQVLRNINVFFQPSPEQRNHWIAESKREGRQFLHNIFIFFKSTPPQSLAREQVSPHLPEDINFDIELNSFRQPLVAGQ